VRKKVEKKKKKPQGKNIIVYLFHRATIIKAALEIGEGISRNNDVLTDLGRVHLASD